MSEAIETGTLLGRYQIVSRIGAGGMGEVYRARDTRLARDVAVKVLLRAFSADTDRLRRFEQEAQAAGALNHPNVPAIYDVGTHEGSTYVVSELLEGETLRDRLDSGAVPVRKAVDYALSRARHNTSCSATSRATAAPSSRPSTRPPTSTASRPARRASATSPGSTTPSSKTSRRTAALPTSTRAASGRSKSAASISRPARAHRSRKSRPQTPPASSTRRASSSRPAATPTSIFLRRPLCDLYVVEGLK